MKCHYVDLIIKVSEIIVSLRRYDHGLVVAEIHSKEIVRILETVILLDKAEFR